MEKTLNSNQITDNLRNTSLKDIESVYSELGSSLDGLSPVEAAQWL